MRRIKITGKYKKWAKGYEHKMQSVQEFFRVSKGKQVSVKIKPLDNLKDLKSVFDNPACTVNIKVAKNHENPLTPAEKKKYSDYIDLIIQRFPNKLLSLTPTGMEALIGEFENKGWKELPKDVIHLPGIKDAKPFGKIIYEKMQYEDVRCFIMPAYIRLMGIKTCCYCNANYTVTDKHGTGHYQLDHWKPKSLYPYLCISYFNLQPCCASCNLHKSNDDTLEFLNLYEDRRGELLDVFEFKFRKGAVASYIRSHDASLIEYNWMEKVAQYKKMHDDMDGKLHIESLYQEHNDEVEELIWKSLFYNGSFYDAIKESDFGEKMNISKEEVNRFILGTYSEESEIHKRPLTKLKQDLGKELGLI